jgi:hypothetical protein
MPWSAEVAVGPYSTVIELAPVSTGHSA